MYPSDDKIWEKNKDKPRQKVITENQVPNNVEVIVRILDKVFKL